MARNIDEFLRYMDATAVQRQKAMWKEADAEINGNEEHDRARDYHPTGGLGTKGPLC